MEKEEGLVVAVIVIVVVTRRGSRRTKATRWTNLLAFKRGRTQSSKGSRKQN